MSDRVLDILVDNFEADADVLIRSSARMGLADWMFLTSLARPDLKDTPFVPRLAWRSTEMEHILEAIKYEDAIVHHPFDSFTSVERFLTAAVRDPQVVAIKMTLYRIGSNSPLVDLLIEAAEQGKQVAVLVELKARFDEKSNIGWAERLEDAGVHVVYGLLNLKTHCKLCLVVRKAGDGIQRYAHIGTGNYNRSTALVYTDIGLFTANQQIVSDISELFNYLTGYSHQSRFRALAAAPINLRARFVELIERETAHAAAGRPAHIIAKCNALSDPDMVRAFYRASRAGVPIDLIVRGVCCLRPGVPGVSDGIRVRSIVGRFLEHSRIYWFANGGSEEIYIGSADLMERNLNRRVETIAPILNPAHGKYLRDVVLDAYLRDNTRAFTLDGSGAYRQVQPGHDETPFSAQQFLLDWAAAQDHGEG
jgi:polyphosphate kinase